MSEQPVTVEAPLHGPWGQIQSWLQAGPPGAVRLLEQVAFSPVLSDQSFAPGDEELRELWGSGGWVSWLGGPAAAPLDGWPRTVDGTALAHVLTLHLADLAGVLDDQGKAVWSGLREGLPTVGVLEVFHDLRTFGSDATDQDRGAWVVRWVADPARTELVQPPKGVDTPSAVCQVVLALPGFTLPRPPMPPVGRRRNTRPPGPWKSRYDGRGWPSAPAPHGAIRHWSATSTGTASTGRSVPGPCCTTCCR
ncbi:hypothetical protein ABL57_10420 [Kocuria sp. SM24M-10]|nr:hypothetical protein ABL57_10420 [Kocuria sp. SM24M-10]